jgi:hypothetical protein
MRLELDTVAEEWQVAFDQAAEAIDAADGAYSTAEGIRLRHELARERAETTRLLELVLQAERSKITSTVSCS